MDQIPAILCFMHITETAIKQIISTFIYKLYVCIVGSQGASQLGGIF